MLTDEELEFQRNYHFWECDNRFKQQYDNHWCKFYGGPLHNIWQRVDDTALYFYTIYPNNNFTFIRKITFETIKDSWPKIAVYKPVIQNFTIQSKSPMRNVTDIIVDYVYVGCQQ